MICFALELNGRRLATAGIPGFAVLNAGLTWVQRKPRNSKAGSSDLELRLGGLDSNSETDDGTHLSWVNETLHVGDRVVFKVLEGEKSDPPKSGRRSFTSGELEKDRARSARHYLKEYRRQRAGLDKRIRGLEKVVAAATKKAALRRRGGKG